MTNKLIGFAGKIGTGKSTAVNAFMHNINRYARPAYKNWKVDAFADPIKQITSYMFGITREELEDREVKNKLIPFRLQDDYTKPMTYGQFMQLFGTNVGRIINSKMWIDKLYRTYWVGNKEQNVLSTNLLLTDIRFQNEADFVKSKDGIIIAFTGKSFVDENMDSRDYNHESEAMDITLDTFDYVINLNVFDTPAKVGEYLKFIIVNEKII